MLPYQWEDVDFATLFTPGLIPADLTQEGGTTRASISGPLTSENMSRFHFYAPFIKKISLELYYNSLVLDNWEPLMIYSHTTEILPNLVEFGCWKPELQPLCVFPSSLTEVVNLSGEVDISLISSLLALLAKKSPRIQKLEFYSGSNRSVSSIEAIPPQTFVSLSKFRNLRQLVSNTTILQPHALQSLAQLPNLTELRIRDYNLAAGSSLQLHDRLPANSFPSLVSLRIDFQAPQDAKKFWELIPLKMLNKVHIYIQSPGDEGQPRFVPSLCNESPQIKELRIDFFKKLEGDDEVYNLRDDMFEYLGRLPLDRTFSITSAKLDFDDAWARVARSWPNLREFHCIHQTMRIEDLELLSANLPNLCELECDFDLAHATRTVGRGWQPAGHPPFYPNLRKLSTKSFDLMDLVLTDEAHSVDNLARFFGYFWPNLQICWDTLDESFEPEHDSCQEASFFMFGHLIKAHARSFHNV